MKLPKQIELLQNMSYVLQCNIQSGSIPTVTFDWNKLPNSAKLIDSSNIKIENFDKFSTLALKNVQSNDSGTYTCNVRNAHGSDSTSTLLQILSKI